MHHCQGCHHNWTTSTTVILWSNVICNLLLRYRNTSPVYGFMHQKGLSDAPLFYVKSHNLILLCMEHTMSLVNSFSVFISEVTEGKPPVFLLKCLQEGSCLILSFAQYNLPSFISLKLLISLQIWDPKTLFILLLIWP